MKPSGQPYVSVVIPTLNGGHAFQRLLEAIDSQQFDGDVEVVVIDSGSRDGTRERARKASAKVLAIPHRRFNHSKARNQAIRASRGEFVALTVQDALPADDHWLTRLVTPMLKQSRVAGTYGLQAAPPASSLLARTRSSLWCEAHALPQLNSLESQREYQGVQPHERLELVRFDNVTSCIRRSVWEELPLPDCSYGEDMAWAKSVLLAGYKTAYIPEAQVWHTHERGHLYELRRAYVDGYARVQLVDWPALCLEWGEVVSILRRMMFFLLTKRFDSVVDPEDARSFLLSEIYRYTPLAAQRPARIYVNVLEFAVGLTRRATRLCPKGIFPEKAWIDLFRFAVAVIVGQTLGAAATTTMNRSRSFEKAAWHALNWFLSRSV